MHVWLPSTIASRVVHPLALALGLVLLAAASLLAPPPTPAHAQGEAGKVLMYTGTTGYRHGGGQSIDDNAVNTTIAALEAAGFEVDYRTCDGFGTGAGNGDPSLVTNTNLVGCRNPDLGNPATFTSENLAQYDAIYLHSASDYWTGRPGGAGTPGQLWNASEETAIIDFVQNGGGIAAIHNITDAASGDTVSWDWWDGGPDSVVGTTMGSHAATDINNEATVQVADRNHPSTKDLPDTYEFGDEHYNYFTNVRGTHHVLATLDERSYNVTGNPTGRQDHPISWCKSYDGDNVEDGTGNPKSYDDGRTWVSGMGHFAASFTENGGDNELIKHIVGGVSWVAGEGKKSDCGGTVWDNFTRTVLVSDANNPIGMDIAPDGKVYWSEIGPTISNTSEGYVKMHDPDGAPNNKTTVATIPTRADHANSEDGVLGMALEPGFDLSDPAKRDLYVYYSPRFPDFTDANAYMVGYNLISRFTLNADGTAVVPDSEREILRVPKVKLNGNPTWCEGTNCTGNGPGHVGGAGLAFDSDGNLYLGVGDDVAPNEGGHGTYPPLDYRAAEHRDARKTAANTNDLRGKIVRVTPLDEIPADTEPGVGETYSIPAGNMFTEGTPNTRPEIYAMGFRQPFTVHTDPANPGTAVVGEYCHDAGSNLANRAPAGGCEWNLIDEPGFHGWPFCVADNSPANTSYRWDYTNNTSTLSQYDCSLANIPSDLDYAPAGQTNPGPTYQGQANIPGPAVPATIWKKTTNEQPVADFGDLTAGGNQPITGPIYRYDPDTAGPGAFPAYYDGSWLINNRGSDNGFWKEVRLRSDNNEMLRVHDWLPYNAAGATNADFNSSVIPTRFGPDGALYMGRFAVGCCRGQINGTQQTQIVKIEFNVQDECLADTQAPNTSHEVQGQPHPTDPDTYLIGGMEDSADVRITANDVGCAGVDTIEYRVNSDSPDDWVAYEGPVAFDTAGSYAVDYRATDGFTNTSEIATATFTVEEANDTDPPAVDAMLSGSQNDDGEYVGSATLDLEATDAISGIDSIEHSINDGAFTATGFDGSNPTESTDVDFTEPGDYTVAYRATDTSANTSTAEEIAFTVIEGDGCVGGLSDEFDAPQLDEKWNVRVEDGEPVVAGGELILPILNEIDGTVTGPLALVSQQVPDGDWSLTTRVTPDLETSWAQAGIMLWQSDGNFIKIVFGRDANSGDRRFEIASDDPTDTRNLNSPNQVVDGSFPETAWIRASREGDIIMAEFAPDEGGAPGEWQPFGGTRPVSGVDPLSGIEIDPPREGEGVQLGLYAGSDVDGAPFEQEAAFDFARFEPDDSQCGEDTTPPVTTAELDPPEPGPGGTYSEPVTVLLNAMDEPGGSGVDFTEYSLNDGATWTLYDGLMPPTISAPGEHTVLYRSTDVAENVEDPAGSVSFTIEGEPGGAELGLSVKPKSKTVKAGKKATFTTTVANTGDAAATQVKVCAKAPRSKVTVKGNACTTTPTLEPEASDNSKFTLKPKRSARGKKLTIKFVATSPDAEKATAQATLKVKRR